MPTWPDNLKIIESLWPKWQPNPEQAREWSSALGSQSNQAVVELAIRKHFRESTWKEPKLNRILALMDSERQQRRSGQPVQLSQAETLRMRWGAEKPDLASLFNSMSDGEILMHEAKCIYDRAVDLFGARSEHAAFKYWEWQMVCHEYGCRDKPFPTQRDHASYLVDFGHALQAETGAAAS